MAEANDAGILDALTGLQVETWGVVNNHDETLTREGAQAIFDRLRARGYKIERVKVDD